MKKSLSEHYLRNKAKIIARVTKTQRDNPIATLRKVTKWAKEHPERRKQILEKYKAKNSHKLKARERLNREIKKGTIKRGRCEVCNKKKVEAHHDDYSQPLKVRWVCTKHHGEIHRKIILPLILFCLMLTNCSEGIWRIKESNDFFTAVNNDKEFTQGLEVSHETESEFSSVGQNVWTPDHKHLFPAPPDERPYAGMLYARHDERRPWFENTKYFYGAELGLIGPASGGEVSQCDVHALLGQECPKGWPDQLHNELGLTLRTGFIHEQPAELWLFPDGVNKNTVTIETGNFYDALRFETEVRSGENLFYYFAGPKMSLVARDITLDGNTFTDSAHVSKKWYTTEMRIGVGTHFGKYNVEWVISVTSPEFKGEGQSYNFGVINVSWKN